MNPPALWLQAIKAGDGEHGRSKLRPLPQALMPFTVVGPKPARERYGLPQDILANLRSGITVGLVNLPLSVSLAIASGATPEMGALSATWGGIVGGLTCGSHFSLVSSPRRLVSPIPKGGASPSETVSHTLSRVADRTYGRAQWRAGQLRGNIWARLPAHPRHFDRTHLGRRLET